MHSKKKITKYRVSQLHIETNKLRNRDTMLDLQNVELISKEEVRRITQSYRTTKRKMEKCQQLNLVNVEKKYSARGMGRQRMRRSLKNKCIAI